MCAGSHVISEPHPAASNGQVGGYRTVYKQMTFATVRGAGHMVNTADCTACVYSRLYSMCVQQHSLQNVPCKMTTSLSV